MTFRLELILKTGHTQNLILKAPYEWQSLYDILNAIHKYISDPTVVSFTGIDDDHYTISFGKVIFAAIEPYNELSVA